MDRNNRFQPYDRAPPRQQNQQQQPYGGGNINNNNFRRDDYGNTGGGVRRGGGGGGGAMRDQRGRRGPNNNNERYNDNGRPYNKRRPMGGVRVKNEYQEESNETYGYEDPDDRLPPHIESRVAREKPCRTLFVRNVQYTISENEVRSLFEKYGEVKDVFNLIENRGMIFVTFYDVRAAEDAKEAMQGVFLSDRKIDVHYSLPKEEEEKARCDRTKNQGTLLYTLKNSSFELDDYELQSYFAQYGEVKAIRVPHFKKSTAHNFNHQERNQQRLVEFYDSRACVDAYDATLDTEYKGGKWDVAFFWDHPYKERANAHQRRERNQDREDIRAANNRRRSDPPVRRDGYDHYNGGGMRDDNRYVPPPPLTSHHADPRLQYQSMAPPTVPSTSSAAAFPDNQRLEQAQKAQQILSMLAHSQQQQTSPQQPASLTSPFQPPNVQSPPVQQHMAPQQSFVQPVPPTEDQASQVQQLLGLLSQAAQQQQQHQQHQQLPPPPPQQQQHQPPQQMAPHAPAIPQNVAPIPGMDPATALSQLAALLQQQQQQQNQNQ